MTRLQHALGLDHYPNVFEHFDIVAGTGTGAIIVCLVGRLRISVRQAIVYYQRLASVFSKKRPIKGEDGAFRIRKLADVMKGIVGEITGDENTSMIDTRADANQCKTMVFAMSKHNMNGAIPSVFRSYPVITNQLDDCAIWEAACASMAHPELFSSFDIGQGPLRQSYVGGTLGCSNPIEHVLAEAKTLFPSRYLSSILSIGAGHTRTIQISQPKLLQNILSTNAVVAMKDVAKDSKAAAQRTAARFQQAQDVYFRLNVEQGMQDMKMCDWEKLGEVRAHTIAYMRQAGVSTQLANAVKKLKERNGDIGMRKIDGQVQAPSRYSTGAILCPAPTPVFTGQEDKIAQVIRCLSDGDKKRCVFVLHGMGGAGKTQIALKTVERTYDMWSEVVYVDATTRETAIKSLEAYAQVRDIGKTYQETMAYLNSRRERWLMVIDSADDPSFSIGDFLPLGDHGSILITSRLVDMAIQGRGPNSDCQMSSMKPEEALELVMKTARIDITQLSSEEKNAADALLEGLGYLALATVHAGAYIHSSGCTIPQYLEMFLSQRRITLERYEELRVRVDGYQKSVYTTWIMSYERLSDKAKVLMELMAYMHHTNITQDMFKRAAIGLQTYNTLVPASTVELQVQKDLEGYLEPYIDSNGFWNSGAFLSVMTELRSYSLISYDRAHDAYTIHVLVHDWTRTTIAHQQEVAVWHTMTLLAASRTQDGSVNSLCHARSLDVHVNSVLGTEVKPSANHAFEFLYVYWCTGNWDKMESMVHLALDICRAILGEDHIHTLGLMYTLASTYSDQGRYNEAEVLQLDVLNARKTTLGDKHPDTLASMHSLAATYSDQGRHNEAEVLQLDVLSGRRTILGDKHPDTLASMHNLAVTYSRQGRHNEAEVLQLDVLSARRTILGDKHPDTLASMHSLAAIYSDQGRHNEAEVLYLEVLDIRKQVIGDEHPGTLFTMLSLAFTHWSRGLYREAEALQVWLLEPMKRLLGPRHPETLRNMRNLALTYESLGPSRQSERKALLLEIDRVSKERNMAPHF